MNREAQTSDLRDPARLLQAMFAEVLEAAQPRRFLLDFLPRERSRPLTVIGAGKASGSMASALENLWDGPLKGFVSVPYGYAVPCSRLDVVEARHPIPDANSVRAGERALNLAAEVQAGEHVLCLISGGGSATLCALPEGVTLEQKQRINESLLRSGADIREMNCVRRHISRIKGGRLAKALKGARARVLIVSDVPGDSPIDIASGPLAPDDTTCSDALRVIGKYDIWCPPNVLQMFRNGALESVGSGDQCFSNVELICAMSPFRALEAAAALPNKLSVPTLMFGDDIQGEAADVGKVFAGICRSIWRYGAPLKPPCILLSGGETSVTVRGKGRGGRNVEFLAALLNSLRGEVPVHAIAADTDGVDGAEPVAGAWIDPDSFSKAHSLGLDPGDFLARNDCHTFFAALGQQIVTGPTLTNVNDFRAIYVRAPDRH